MQEAQQAQSKTQTLPNISDGCVGLRALAQPTGCALFLFIL